MSFITKRERVFSEYNNANLPPRGDGKLKAYSSCTDTRAWSHFVSDKTEHLIEIIKRNNEVCPGKYVPVGVIVEMMMSAKKAEINRLKRKISQLEQMLTVYDQLELSCEQKCEISSALGMIKAAHKSLEELPPLDLDMSGITEITDSEGFMTGQSCGDDGTAEAKHKGLEWSPRPALKFKDSQTSPGVKFKDSKASKDYRDFKSNTVSSYVSTTDLPCRGRSDVSTSIHDSRVDDMKEALISKDAKLNALQNTIAVMENDVCEPYCIYAHIYTALEKIYATLSQNDKYKLFLNLMTAGKDTRCLDIKGKILFKLKILEKFSIALLAPCTERLKHDQTCDCYYASVASTHVEATFALTSAENKPPDSKRTQLIADIIDNDELKELLQHGSTHKLDELPEDIFVTETYSTIDSDNLSRLKNLQNNYDELLAYYENVKHERDNLRKRCKRYEEMEVEFEDMKVQLREYNTLYNEREYYRHRSEDLDSLKEQYLVLRDETAGLETQIKAEAEINSIKSNTIDDLRISNIALEQRLNEASIGFEKEKNSVLCKLKEAECTIMCQEQQIRSLAAQVDRLLAQDPGKNAEHVPQSAYVMDEIDDLKSQVKNLNDALYSSEDEKQQLQIQFEANLQLINDFRMEIENWKSEFEKARQRNEYLEKYSEGLKDDIQKLAEDVDEKNAAMANLMGIIHNKSQEVNRLMQNMEAARDENQNLTKNLQELIDKYGCSIQEHESEKNQVLDSLKLAKKESQELLDKVRDYDQLLSMKEDLIKKLASESNSCTELRNKLANAMEENKKLLSDLSTQENSNLLLCNENEKLRQINDTVSNELKILQNSKDTLEKSYELKKKESEDLEERFDELKKLKEQFRKLYCAHEKLINEKTKLEKLLHDRTKDLDDAITKVELTKKESLGLLEKLEHSENLKEDMITLSKDYRKLINDKQELQNDLKQKSKELDNLAQIIADLRTQNDDLWRQSQKCKDLEKEIAEMKKSYIEVLNEKAQLEKDFENKTQEIKILYNTLEEKIEENRNLIDEVKALQHDELETSENLSRLQDMNENTQSMLSALRKESKELLTKLRNYENLLEEYEELKLHDDGMKKDNDNLVASLEKLEAEKQDLINQREDMVSQNEKLEQENKKLEKENESLLARLEKLESEKQALINQRGDMMSQNEELEKALTDARKELIQVHSQVSYGDLVKEIENMKNEKTKNQLKIKDLLEKLDETDNIICNLSEDVLARDDRIAVMQNHINALEDEVLHLHQRLEQLLNTGEEIKDNSIKKIDQSLNQMEAHHSKATHNMKMELAKLQNENSQLEEQVTINKMKSNESFKHTNKYISQLVHLQNEREIIVTDIKQLELSCVGDTKLSPTHCDIEDILTSLDNIQKCIDSKNSKSNSLEQTLLKVQSSSQLLLTKADEAKKLVEREKQKIISEKEQAIAEKLNMEQQLFDLKEQLQNQTSHDKKIIDDLERELLNQKLIIDKLNEQTQSYISNLEDELKSLKDLYQNSLDKIKQLKDQTKNLKEENDKKDALVKKISTDLMTKSKEIEKLQNDFKELKYKPKCDRDIQVGNSTSDNRSQTDGYLVEPNGDELVRADEFDKINEDVDIVMLEMNNIQNKYASESKSKEKLDLQILAAKVDPNFDFVKNSYVDYKLKRLQSGNLEHISIPEVIDNNEEKLNQVTIGSSKNEIFYVDNLLNSESNEATTSSNMHPGQSYTTTDTSRLLDSYTDALETNSYKSKENDLFLIYKESDISTADEKSVKDKGISPKKPTIVVETVAIQSDAKYTPHKKTLSPYKEITFDQSDEGSRDRSPEKRDISPGKTDVNKSQLQFTKRDISSKDRLPGKTDVEKIQLDITLPRVDVLPAEDMNSFVLFEHKDQTLNLFKESPKYEQTSDHLLTRVEADVFLLKNRDGDSDKKMLKKRNSSQDFGLEYLLYSVRQEFDLHSLRKSRSDSSSSHSKYHDSSPEKQNEQYLPCSTKSCQHYKSKKFQDQSVDVNMDAPVDYENKIQRLSLQLENTEKDYKKKLEAIKAQYDNHIKSIINDHNQGVNSIQTLHEETLQDVIKMHENEVENLRTMSIEAMRKADKLVKQNKMLQLKLQNCNCLDEEPIKISSPELKKRRSKRYSDMKMLSKTKIEAFNVKPKVKQYGPCTCSLEVNLSDTIRNIFEQVDVEQRKLAERTYLKFIANKILSSNIESLDVNELSFLHLKVCRTWKNKICKDEAMQKKMDTLESQVLVRERSRKQHIADLDRALVEQRRRLSEARDAVCNCSPSRSSDPLQFQCTGSSEGRHRSPDSNTSPSLVPYYADTSISAHEAFLLANPPTCSQDENVQNDLSDQRSAGDLLPGYFESNCMSTHKPRRRTPLTKNDVEDRREKKMCDEHPTRLRRSHVGNSRPARKF